MSELIGGLVIAGTVGGLIALAINHVVMSIQPTPREIEEMFARVRREDERMPEVRKEIDRLFHEHEEWKQKTAEGE